MQGPPLTKAEVTATLSHGVNRLIETGVDRMSAIRLVARRFNVPPIAVVAALRNTASEADDDIDVHLSPIEAAVALTGAVKFYERSGSDRVAARQLVARDNDLTVNAVLAAERMVTRLKGQVA